MLKDKNCLCASSPCHSGGACCPEWRLLQLNYWLACVQQLCAVCSQNQLLVPRQEDFNTQALLLSAYLYPSVQCLARGNNWGMHGASREPGLAVTLLEASSSLQKDLVSGCLARVVWILCEHWESEGNRYLISKIWTIISVCNLVFGW